MSPSDRTAKRLRAVKKAVKDGKLSPELGEKKLQALAALGAKYTARWTLPDGSDRTKTFKSKSAAKTYEAEQKALVKRREHHDPLHIRATLREIFDYYLENRMHRNGKPKASFGNVRAHCNRVVRLLGEKFTLESLDLDPELHIAKLKKALEREVPGGAWNNKVSAAAAVGYWIRRKRLGRMANPFDAFDWAAPDNERKQRISFEGHRKALEAARALRATWLPTFLEAGWETGWRSGEVQDWQIERLHLNPEGEDFPWVLTLIEKQGDSLPIYEEKPITFRLASLLKALIGNRTQGPLWPVKRTATDRWVRRALDGAGLQDYRFHDYRRSIKKRMEESGVSDDLGGDYTGHGEDMHNRYKRAGRTRADFHSVLRKLEPGHFRDTEGDNE